MFRSIFKVYKVISYHTVLYSGPIFTTAWPLASAVTGTEALRSPRSSSAQHFVAAAFDGSVIVAGMPSFTVLPFPQSAPRQWT